MKPTTKVIDCKEPPALKNPVMLQGIRDRAAAQAWGEKNGYGMVYYMPKKQRVYAERLQTNEMASDPLLDDAKVLCAEHGFGSVGYLQQKMRIGYSRASRLIDLLIQSGFFDAGGQGPRFELAESADRNG